MTWHQSLAFLITAVGVTSALNIMHITDMKNMMAKNVLDAVVQYVEANGMEMNINRYLAENSMDETLKLPNVCELLQVALDAGNPPHLIVDTTYSGVNSEIAKMLAKKLAVPTISTSYGDYNDLREWVDLSDEQMDYLVHVRPPGDILPNIIRDSIIKRNISNAAILYDKNFVMDYKYKSLMQNIPCRHIIIQLPMDQDMGEVSKQLMRVKEAELSNVFVLSGIEMAKVVLNQANDAGMVNRQHSWFFISKETDPLECGCTNASVIHAMPRISDLARQRLQALRNNQQLTNKPDLDAAFYFDTILSAVMAAGTMEKNGEYPADYKVASCSEMDQEMVRPSIPLLATMTRMQVPETLGNIMLSSNGQSFMEITMQMYMDKIIASQLVSQDPIGSYVATPDRGNFREMNEMVFSSNKAITLYKIVTLVQPPFIYREETADGVRYVGYCMELLQTIKEELNFEYEIYEVPDGKYGFMDEEGNWNGMIRELIDKKADIALGALSLMAEREEFVDFTVSYYDLVGTTIIMKKPIVDSALFRFLTVLESEVWGCIVAAYFVTSLLLWVFDRLSPYSYQNNSEAYVEDDEKRVFSAKESFWFCITSLTPQGGGETPKCLSGRLVVGTWWLFGFIIIASYTANLAAFLTVSRLQTPIESLDGLYSQYKIKYAPRKDSSSMEYFKRMAYIESRFYEVWKQMSLNMSASVMDRAKLAVWHYPVSDKYTKMWETMQENGMPETTEEGFARVLSSPSNTEGFAFIDEQTIIDYKVLTSCDFVAVGDPMSAKPYSLAVQKGSLLKHEFTRVILKLMNERKLELLKEKWWAQNPNRVVCDDVDDDSDGISIYNIGGVFIVIFVGVVLACFTLLFEYWYYKYWRPEADNNASGNKVAAISGDPTPHKVAGPHDPPSTDFNPNYGIQSEGDQPSPAW